MISSLISLVLVAGCGFIPERGVGEHSSQLVRDQSIDVAGSIRNYHLYVPADPADASTVLLLHGNGGSADQLIGVDRAKAPYTVWLDIAERENLLLIVPDGATGPNGKQGWNDCRTDAKTNPATSDTDVLSSLLDDVQARYGNGSRPVFVAGTSNGGMMSQRLADELPERLDAVAVVVASRPINNECADSTVALPILFMNGTDDPILPYDGGNIAGDRGEVLPTVGTVAHWVERNRADTSAVRTDVPDRDTRDGSRIIRLTYAGGTGGAVVMHYEVVNGGHTEPSMAQRYGRLFKRIVGEQNGDIEMAEEIWSFFDAQ